MEVLKPKAKIICEAISVQKCIPSLRTLVIALTWLQFLYSGGIAAKCLLCTFPLFVGTSGSCMGGVLALFIVFFCMPILIVDITALVLTGYIYRAICKKEMDARTRNLNIFLMMLKVGILSFLLLLLIHVENGNLSSVEGIVWILAGFDLSNCLFYFGMVHLHYLNECKARKHLEKKLEEEEWPIVNV